MTYGPKNEGTLTFLGDGKISGNIEGAFLGNVVFSGKKDPEYAGRPIVWSMNVKKSWKGQWRGINERAYSAANASRWGGWNSDRDFKERGADSDTTIAGEEELEIIDEEDW